MKKLSKLSIVEEFISTLDDAPLDEAEQALLLVGGAEFMTSGGGNNCRCGGDNCKCGVDNNCNCP